MQQAVILFASNPAAWIGCLLAYERLSMQSPVLFFPTYLLVWLLLQCVFAGVTTFVTPLKCLGAGYLYLFNTSLITSLLLGTAFKQTLVPSISKPFILLALTIGLLVLFRDVFLRAMWYGGRGRGRDGGGHPIIAH